MKSLQIGALPRFRFCGQAVQGQFNDGGNKSLNFLPLLSRVTGFLRATE